MPTVSSGSAITTLGIISGWKITFLVWVVSSVMTPARPTSEPVPAVVGTATMGKMPLGSARVHQSPISSKSHIGRVCPAMKAMTLPTSSPEPPPKAMTPSWPPSRSTLMPASTLAEIGLGFTSAKSADGNAGILEQLRCVFCVTGRLTRPASVTSRGLRDAGGLERLGQFGDAAGAEFDGGGVVPVGFGHVRFCLPIRGVIPAQAGIHPVGLPHAGSLLIATDMDPGLRRDDTAGG